MNSETIITSLGLPVGSRLDKRIPKKLLLENGAPTAADKRYINVGIDRLQWLAALKPTTIGVPEYRDSAREYLEIAVLGLFLRSGAKDGRLVELVHRAVPYPVLLVTDHGGRAGLSAAHKRWAQNEAGKTVLEDAVVAVDCESDTVNQPAFQEALALDRQPRGSLYLLYQGWIDTLVAAQAARMTGEFTLVSAPDRALQRHSALQECERLDAEMERLSSAAAKEKQVPRQVELNLELKRLRKARETARKKL